MALELQTKHPQSSIDTIAELAKKQEITTSPHVGNLDNHNNPNYIALALLGVKIEMVDTITCGDRSGRPHIIVKGDEERVVCTVPRKQRDKVVPSAVLLGDSTITDMHLAPLQHMGVPVTTSTEFFASIGEKQGMIRGDVLAALMRASNQLVRHAQSGRVSGCHENKKHSDTLDEHGLFGVGDDQLSGLMLPLPAMMAAEIVEAVIHGKDVIHHVGGHDMTQYTKQEHMMRAVTGIAQRALSELDVVARGDILYIVHNKNGGIKGLAEESASIEKKIGVENFSQHDVADHLDLFGSEQLQEGLIV